MTFTLPPLSYEYNALEPHIDAMTMEIHHSKHHAAYVNNLNNAIQWTQWENKSMEEMFAQTDKLTPAIRNNAWWHYNHSMFWEIIGPNGGELGSGPLADAINLAFGSFEKCKEGLANAWMTRFGSWWSWLVVQENGTLAICSTPNQDNPLMNTAETKGFPILCIDVWEHAYYLKYQNKRADYLSAFWNIVQRKELEKRFGLAKQTN